MGLNNKNILRVEEWRREEEAKGNPLVSDAAPLPDWQIAIFRLVLGAIDAIFTQRWLLTSLLERFATEETVRGALADGVYVNSDRVDAPLVDDYLSLATDTAAASEVLRQIYTNDGGPLPFRAAAALPDELPLLTVWGDQDNLGPISGPVGSFFRARARRLERSAFEEVAGCGHVPQDDRPDVVNTILAEWLAAAK